MAAKRKEPTRESHPYATQFRYGLLKRHKTLAKAVDDVTAKLQGQLAWSTSFASESVPVLIAAIDKVAALKRRGLAPNAMESIEVPNTDTYSGVTITVTFYHQLPITDTTQTLLG